VYRKRGRLAQYVHGRTGKPIVGLSREAKSRRSYATGTHPRIYFGTDYDSALMRFRTREAQGRYIRLIAREPLIPNNEDHVTADAEGWIAPKNAEQLVPWAVCVTEKSFYGKVREPLANRPS